MRTFTLISSLLAVLLTGSVAIAQDDFDPTKPPTCTSCKKETYGTTIEWMGSASEAAVKAKKEEKLVFVLHVSGHFEDPKFT